MKRKYLPLYYKWIETGEMPDYGLCYSVDPLYGMDPLLSLFAPIGADEERGVLFWGSGLPYAARFQFTTLRQTILLFMAAINDEL